MTARAGFSGVVVFIVAAAGLALRAQAPAGQTVFRSATDLVTIDVAVRASGTPVGGLTANDFILLDNGVRQDVEAVELEAVPVDITILIDASGDMTDHVSDLTEQARKIAAMARPTDRVRVMQFGTYISDIIAAQPAATMPEIAKPVPTGLPSAHDAIVMALLRRVEPDRRHLVIAITNGIDAISTLDAASVRDIARHSSARLEIAQVDVALRECPPCPPYYIAGRERLEHARSGIAMVISQKRPFWRPYDDEQFDVLSEAAAATGGALHLPGFFIDRDASAIFEKVFADYQRSYVLRYTPQGVARVGWHTVKVTIPKYGSYTIHARPGYAVEPGGAIANAMPAVTTPVETVAAPPPLSTIEGLKIAYDAANYAELTAALRNADATRQSTRLVDLIRDLGRGGNPWPANPHREAVFALELVEAGLQSSDADAVQSAARLLPFYAKLVRDPLGPAAFERTWLQAAVALLEREPHVALAPKFVDDAVARFPDEPQFLEARGSLGAEVRILGAARVPSSAATYAALIEQLRRDTR